MRDGERSQKTGQDGLMVGIAYRNVGPIRAEYAEFPFRAKNPDDGQYALTRDLA